MANKWLKQLRAYDDAVNYEYDSFAPENCLYTPSPYFNWIFANKAGGLPKNASILFFSEAKAGKSLAIYSMVLEMQRRDRHLPDDKKRHAIIFNTELRGQLQYDVFPEIDKNYMTIYDTNDAVEIFDRIENDIKPMVQDGMPLGIIAIDSLTQIEGIKRQNAESVSDHLIGDHAMTITIGLGKLIPFCKRNKIALLATSQMRGNVDAANKYAPKEKMAESFAAKHAFEYYISLKRAGAAEDKADIEGKTFTDEDLVDARGNELTTGHKIYVKMEMSSIGQASRSGVFMMDYKKGIINQHEEIFWLAKNLGIINLEGKANYTYKAQKFFGKKECALAIRDNPELAGAILADIAALDQRESA